MEDQLHREDRNRLQEVYTGPPTISKSSEATKGHGESLGCLYQNCADYSQVLVHQKALPPKKSPPLSTKTKTLS